MRHPLKGPCKYGKRGAGSSLSHLFLHPPHLTRGSQAQGKCDLSKATQHVRGATGPDLQVCSASWPSLVCAWRGLHKTGVPLHAHLFLLGPSPCIQKRRTGQRAVCTVERRRLAGDGDLSLCSWESGWSHHHTPLRVVVGNFLRGIFSCGPFLPTFSRIACEAPMYQLQPQAHGTPVVLPQDHGKSCLMPIVQMGHPGLTGKCFSTFVSCLRQRRQAPLITWPCG